MFKVNPYFPGAGTKPTYLAGRDQIINEMEITFNALNMSIPVQSIIFSGLRGVGKTVLINKIYDIAEENNIFCRHIEVETRNDFISQITSCAQAYLRKYNSKEKFKNIINKAVDAIKCLSISFNPQDNTFSLSANEKILYDGVNLNQGLTELFVSLGDLASKVDMPICIFIDEMQYMKQSELGALISAVHRSNQLGYPIMVVGAGLPKLYKMLSEEKSYSERLFRYIKIDSLDFNETKKAIEEPLLKFKINYSKEAINKIYNITNGYPYFIQQLCNIVYSMTDEQLIEEKNVISAIDKFYNIMDNGFFRTRYERCSDKEKTFVFAMVKCEDLPCTIGNIAKNLNKSTTSISPQRAQLINKGIIYSVNYGELDFTVPEFDKYIKRHNDYEKWLNNKEID